MLTENNFLEKCSIIDQYLKLITQTARNVHLTCIDVSVLISEHMICCSICHSLIQICLKHMSSINIHEWAKSNNKNGI